MYRLCRIQETSFPRLIKPKAIVQLVSSIGQHARIITPNSASRLTSNYPNGFRTLACCHTSKSANPAGDIGSQFVRGITVFRKSSYPYFPSKPDYLSRSTHLHKPRRIARRRCGAQFPQQPWKIVPSPPQIYHTARIPLIPVTSVISVISVTLQIPHKHLHI